jgi:hypothetical protein
MVLHIGNTSLFDQGLSEGGCGCCGGGDAGDGTGAVATAGAGCGWVMGCVCGMG